MTKSKLFLFMCGQLGIMCLARFLFQWLLKFSGGESLTGPIFSVALVGMVFFAFRIFDGITDPLAGALGDWWVRRGKKRQGLLWGSFFLPALGLLLVFSPTATMPVFLRWVALISGLFIFFLGYTLYAIPYWSLVEDYSAGDKDTRRSLSNMLGLGLILATIIGFVVSPQLVSIWGYKNAALCFAVITVALLLAPIYAAPASQVTYTPKPKDNNTSIFRDFLRSLKNRRFVSLLCILAGSQMSFTILTAAAPFVAINLLNGSESDVSLLLGPLIGTALPMFIWAPRLSARFGWERVMLCASLLLGLFYIFCSLVGVALIGSAMTTAIILFACAGPMISVLLALEGEAIADCARWADEGVSMYFGVQNLVIKALNGLAFLLTSLLITLSLGAWGSGAVRAMIVLAGILLFIGVFLSRTFKTDS